VESVEYSPEWSCSSRSPKLDVEEWKTCLTGKRFFPRASGLVWRWPTETDGVTRTRRPGAGWRELKNRERVRERGGAVSSAIVSPTQSSRGRGSEREICARRQRPRCGNEARSMGPSHGQSLPILVNSTHLHRLLSSEDRAEKFVAMNANNGSQSDNELSMAAMSGRSAASDEDDEDTAVAGRPPPPDLLWSDDCGPARVLETLNQMRATRHFCDVVLQIGKQEVFAHRAVLAAASPYLMDLFAQEPELDNGVRADAKNDLVYQLNGGFQKEAVQILVEYAYTGR